MDSLIGKRSAKAIRTTLKKLPTGSEAYDYAYKEAMDRIEGQVVDLKELAKQILSWITCAKRPLTTLELQHALAVEVGESEIDEENLSDIDDIVSVCAGLVTVDEESDIIRWSIIQHRNILNGRRTLGFLMCKTTSLQLALPIYHLMLSNPASVQQIGNDARLRLKPFYDYAARNWGHHARAAKKEVLRLTLGLLESQAKVAGSSQAMMASRHYMDDSYDSQSVPKQMTGVHIAAYFGLGEAIAALLKNRHGPDSKDTYGLTPLSRAAENGHEAVVKLLQSRGALPL